MALSMPLTDINISSKHFMASDVHTQRFAELYKNGFASQFSARNLIKYVKIRSREHFSFFRNTVSSEADCFSTRSFECISFS